jgi:hypothetical protein
LRERNLRLGGGVCLPASCSPAKIRSYANETILARADLEITSDYDQAIFCSTNDAIPLETIDVVAMYVCESEMEMKNSHCRKTLISILHPTV